MARRYDCTIFWQDKGSRFERSASVTTQGSSARTALNKALGYVKRYHAKRTWRETEGAVFTARVVVGPKVITTPKRVTQEGGE